MTYKRRQAFDSEFDRTLARRADLQNRTSVTTDMRGRVVVLALSALTFSCPEDAARFLRRIIRLESKGKL